MRPDERREPEAEALMATWPPPDDGSAMDYLAALLFGRPLDPEADEGWDSAADYLEAVAAVVVARRGRGLDNRNPRGAKL